MKNFGRGVVAASKLFALGQQPLSYSCGCTTFSATTFKPWETITFVGIVVTGFSRTLHAVESQPLDKVLVTRALCESAS